ncbi:hypothetical protein KDA_46950 [Dictyobacter alpinus]|uniref:Uncharacterized protein n=1 Tax=Dictyobacter alpinus TaxID=2014873 RepID=A0A402BCT3_9CHLR|nr:hypothetical protein KDA_46950 [Dictyobacter alpinus]
MWECPECGANRTLALHRGVLCFKLHDRIKRKTKGQPAALRWVRRDGIWKIVGGGVSNGEKPQ